MTPNEETRLSEIRERVAQPGSRETSADSWGCDDRGWLLDLVDRMRADLDAERANRAGVDRLRESHYELERMLAEERRRAEATIDEQARKLDASRLAYEEEREGHAQTRRSLNAVAFADIENVWLWQGQGDAPESLSCPVVMTADTLREILGRAEKAEARAEDLAKAIQSRDEGLAYEQDRAEQAEAEVARLTAIIQSEDGRLGESVEEASRLRLEVARLTALVDAATMFRFRNVRVVQFGAGHWAVERLDPSHAKGWRVVRSHAFDRRDEALAEASDLAAKETGR